MNNRPDKLPEWALEERIESISDDNGKIIEQSNIGEPPQVKKQYGLLHNNFMGRQWFNWLFKYINAWIRYLDEPITYTSDNLPEISEMPIGKIIYVTDKSTNGSNGIPAFNDGNRWCQINNGKEIG